MEAEPRAVLDELRRREESRLTSYAWVDREQGVVRIPIDRAMEVLAERGFPAPQPTATAEPRREAPP